jgi:hypothetical protein
VQKIRSGHQFLFLLELHLSEYISRIYVTYLDNSSSSSSSVHAFPKFERNKVEHGGVSVEDLSG